MTAIDWHYISIGVVDNFVDHNPFAVFVRMLLLIHMRVDYYSRRQVVVAHKIAHNYTHNFDRMMVDHMEFAVGMDKLVVYWMVD